jgi:hypothetical protein
MDRKQLRETASAVDLPTRKASQPRSGARASSILRRVALAATVAAACGLAGVSTASAEAPWGFEQVTPVQKGSGAVSTSDGFIASPDGERLFHSSMLPYESLPVESSPALVAYLASRGDSGWENLTVDPPVALPQTPVPSAILVRGTVGVSPNLEYAVVASRVPLLPGVDPEGAGMYLKNLRTGGLRLIYATDSDSANYDLFGTANGLATTYVADDGQSVIFGVSRSKLVPDMPDPFPMGTFYTWTAEHGVRLESVVDGAPVLSPWYAGADAIGPRNSMPLDNDGLDHVYYSAGNSDPVGVSEGPPGARTSRLVTYSRLEPPPTPPATPTPTPGKPLAVGASGRYALIQTADNVPLVGGEPADPLPDSRFLYRFDAEAADPADELQYVGVVPQAARVVQMSQDGKTVVFYSTIEQAGSPAESLQKLFVWREGHGLTYLYSAAAGSTATNLTQQLRRLSDNGRYLSFTDNSASLSTTFGVTNNVTAECPTALLAPGPCDHTYRYDVETGVLDCASCRTDGVAPLGPSGTDMRTGAGQIRMNRYQPRTIADDGTVFLTSLDALVPEDRNGLFDVYAWHPDSGLRLISTAALGQRARFIDASADGSRVFIATRERLAASDKDSEDDVYATFAGAGFAEVQPPLVAPCSGGDCRDGSARSGSPAVGSADFSGGGNVAAPGASLSVSRPLTVTGAAVVLRVRVPGAGRIAVSGALVRGARRSVGKARTVRVRVVLSQKARRALRKRGRLGARVRVAFTPQAGGTETRTVTVAFKRPGAKRKGGR